MDSHITDRRVVVVGAGIVGLTTALALAERGARVRVVAEAIDAPDSSVAAALWALPHVEQSERVREWAYETLARLRREADPADGVREQECRVVGIASATQDPWTRGFTPAIRPARADELPDGCGAGTVSSIPLVDTSRYLPALRARCARRGIPVVREHVTDLAAVAGADEIVVVAAGAASATLLGDTEAGVLGSQVVRLGNPGLTRTTIVRDGPLAPLTIVPRFDDVVVVGGASSATDRVPDAEVAADLLARARRVEPALADAAVLSHAVGHRPVRPRIRLQREPGAPGTVFSCYGHGGAGIALSWGTAGAVADLVAAA
jgi:D-amino-acid oxidase